MRRLQILLAVATASALLLAVPACGSESATETAVGTATQPSPVSARDFDPTRFADSTTIDNAWLPMKPGTQLVFQGATTEGKDKIPHRLVFTVTDLTKEIGGVRSVVLWDRDFSAGQLVEAELAFFAQDDSGNVWQLGEYPEEYEDGKIIDVPAWIHGVEKARAGLTIQAEPRLGTPSYSLGWAPAVGFNDRGKVLRTGQRNCVPVSCYDGVLVIDEFNPDEPGKHQLKYYARNVGNIRVGWMGEKETTREVLALVEVRLLGAAEMARVRMQALKLEKSAYKLSKDVYAQTPPARRG